VVVTRDIQALPEPPRRAFMATALGSMLACAPRRSLAAAARPRIVFLSPNSEGNTYWPQVFRIIDRVAHSLGFEFVPYSFGVQDRYARQQGALRILTAEPRPHAVIASPVIGQSAALLEAAEALRIPVFVMGPLFPTELPAIGQTPRSKYKSWAALFNWAEEEKGYALGRALLQAARQQEAFAADGSIQVIGVGGDASWFGSGLRQAGLVRAIADHPQAVLKQVVPTRWTPAEGRALTAKLLKRYPQARVVWAASDQLGAGAAQALVEHGLSLGRNAFTGGLDLSGLGLELVKQGRFVATAASSLLSYAQVAVLAYDHLQGRDFSAELGHTLVFPTLVATKANVAAHLRLSGCVRGMDFKAFSKVHNPRLARYDFSIDAYTKAARSCAGEQQGRI
jgi:ABC-type sugar transport system substrate-binding protein